MIRKILEEKSGYKVWWNGDERGDYSANVGSAEKAGDVKNGLINDKYISKIETEKGFVNFWLSEKALEDGLRFALQEKFDFLKKQKIQVEFISANPTGPLTLGNARGGVYGDVLAKVLEKCGAKVVKEYYVNDAGNQIEILGHSILKDDKAEYAGDYINELALRLRSGQAGGPKDVGEKAAEIILDNIKKTAKDMGIDFDVWFSERKDLREKGRIDEIVKWLKEKDLAHEKGGALWFKASQFGDTEDRVLIKENGEPTYFCADAAYHKNKFVDRKFDKVINVWGADHHGDVGRIKGFVEALGFSAQLEIILMQFVRLLENGKAARMSKRKGTYVLVEDVLREVGKDAFRYFMLTRSANTHMDFDMDLAKEQSKKNPVYYIQYSHARVCSILNKFEIPASLAGRRNPKSETIPNIKLLNSKHERQLILKLIQIPEVLEDISKDYQAHKLTTYIYELAKTFTDFYENVRVLEAESEELKRARLSLVAATRQILEKVLKLMGISAPEKM